MSEDGSVETVELYCFNCGLVIPPYSDRVSGKAHYKHRCVPREVAEQEFRVAAARQMLRDVLQLIDAQEIPQQDPPADSPEVA